MSVRTLIFSPLLFRKSHFLLNRTYIPIRSTCNKPSFSIVMEKARRTAHASTASSSLMGEAQSSTTPTTTTNASETNATATAPSLDEPWSVEQVISTLPTPLPSNPTSPLPFLHTLERLKTTPREGWRRFHVQGSESIADHMYRMSILTLLAPTPLRSRLNIPRCTLLALVHDMAECLVGDITPADPVTKPEKSRRERTTMSYLTHTLLAPATGCSDAGAQIREAWEEYEAGETLESKFVHDVDKLELVLQMVEYERRGQGEVDLGEFVHVAEGVKLEEMKEWCREVLRERVEFWEGVGKVPKNMDDVERVLAEGEGEGEADGSVKEGEAGEGQ
ncbi:MAG: hypothetical protein Q9208_004847 [Pyrenodesmia sp. 3 TL-2023]